MSLVSKGLKLFIVANTPLLLSLPNVTVLELKLCGLSPLREAAGIIFFAASSGVRTCNRQLSRLNAVPTEFSKAAQLNGFKSKLIYSLYRNKTYVWHAGTPDCEFAAVALNMKVLIDLQAVTNIPTHVEIEVWKHAKYV